MNAITKLFAGGLPAAPVPSAPAKRLPRLTCGALNQAITAALGELDRNSSVGQTLEDLYALTNDADDRAPVRLDGASVSLSELDAVLANVCDRELGLPAGVGTTFKKLRALLAAAKVNRKSNGHTEPVQYVTHGQLNTLVGAFAAVVAQVECVAAAPPGHINSRLGHRLALVAGSPAEFGLSSDEATAFKRLVGLIEAARDDDAARERRRSREWLNDVERRRQAPPM